MSEPKDNSGALFRVDNPKSDKHPTHSGKATIAGVDYLMDAWVNEMKDGSGKRYFKMSFKPRGTAAPRGEQSQAPDQSGGEPF